MVLVELDVAGRGESLGVMKSSYGRRRLEVMVCNDKGPQARECKRSAHVSRLAAVVASDRAFNTFLPEARRCSTYTSPSSTSVASLTS